MWQCMHQFICMHVCAGKCECMHVCACVHELVHVCVCYTWFMYVSVYMHALWVLVWVGGLWGLLLGGKCGDDIACGWGWGITGGAFWERIIIFSPFCHCCEVLGITSQVCQPLMSWLDNWMKDDSAVKYMKTQVTDRWVDFLIYLWLQRVLDSTTVLLSDHFGVQLDICLPWPDNSSGCQLKRTFLKHWIRKLQSSRQCAHLLTIVQVYN